MTKTRQPSVFVALLPLIFLVSSLGLNVWLFGSNALDGANQIALLLAATMAGIIAWINGASWGYIQDSVLKSIHTAMPALIILLFIGSLSGTWLISGVVPAMIYYGLKILHPAWFLVACLLVSAIVSMATGSSWSTIATVGLALIGIGNAMGFNPGLAAGAIISGAYFGDKMSPLSDTTNLAAAVAGTNIFTHIRYMLYTTVPSFGLALCLFAIIGFSGAKGTVGTDIQSILSTIDGHFQINLWLFLVPVILVVVIMKRLPAIPALIAGTLLGLIAALIFQPQMLTGSGQGDFSHAGEGYRSLMQAMFTTVTVKTGNSIVDELLTSGGMAGMLPTVWLILSAMIFGGAMEAGALLTRLAGAILHYARSTGSLIATTLATCLFFNITASDQYMAIVVPGRMFLKAYRDRKLKPEVLSRTLEDSGTLTSVLVPWNTCGATQSRVLGVDTIHYLPYCFFNLLNPVVAMGMAFLGYRIRRERDITR